MSKGGGGVQNILEQLSWTFDHFRLFKSAGRKDSVKKPNTFQEANKIKFYTVLLHFAKCCDLRVKRLHNGPKQKGGVQPIWAMPIFRLLFLNCFSYSKPFENSLLLSSIFQFILLVERIIVQRVELPSLTVQVWKQLQEFLVRLGTSLTQFIFYLGLCYSRGTMCKSFSFLA